MALIYADLAICLDGPIALALLQLVLLSAKFGGDYRRYKAEGSRLALTSPFPPEFFARFI